MSKLKVAFIPSNVSGVMAYRCWQPAEAMRALGHKVAVLWYQTDCFMMHPWEEDLISDRFGGNIKRDVEMACEWADVVIWMGLHTPQSIDLFREMRLKNDKPFLMEIDDYVFSIPAQNIASTVYKPGADLTKILQDQMKESDGVICSTPYLAELYRPFNGRVFVVENSVDLDQWKAGARGRNGLTVGWMGGGTHDEDHALVADAVKEVLGKHKGVKAKFICGKSVPSFYQGVPKVEWKEEFVSIKHYPKFMGKQGFDIGIAPLVDNNFNRGKSNLRWLEYSALGLPTVASPLPHFKEAIRHGETGFLAQSHQEWVEALESLINAPELRANVGVAARREVKDKWSPKVMGKKYLSILGKIVNAEPNAV